MRLKDKIAIVTGAAKGFGEAIALRFAQEGANVVIADMDLTNAEKVSQSIRDLGRKSFPLKVDISKKSQVENMVGETINKFERIDILVNNAGISKIISFLETTEEIWDKILDINLKGTFLCCRAVIAQLIKQKKGKIINMSSQSGKQGNSWYAAYCASKFGIIGLTQSLSLEFAPYGININAICPGIAFTSLWNEEHLSQYAKKRNLRAEEAKEYLLKKIPLGRFATPEDVANVALFLASEESDYLTGQALNVAGGQEMR